MACPLFGTTPLDLLLEEMQGENRLRRILGPAQLSALGVGAIIGWDLILEYAVGSATVAHGWSAHFQEFIPIFHEGISAIPARLPDAIRQAPFNYCVSTGAGCPHTGFVSTGSYFDLPAILITFIL